MPYRNKTYVCLDYDADWTYYALMKAWKSNDSIDFDFHNAHDLNNLRDGSSEETIKEKLRERLRNTKIMIVLVGADTKTKYRFVRWEMEVAIKLGIPIVAVNLNGYKSMDDARCPLIIKHSQALHIPYVMEDIKWAIDNWPGAYAQYRQNGDNSSSYHLAKYLN